MLLAAFDATGEELKSAASFALGGVAAGNQAGGVMGRFRYIAWLKSPYRVAGKASALSAGNRTPG